MKIVNKIFIIIILSILLSCSEGSQDLSYANPEWRNTVNTNISFPLEERITIKVGIRANIPAENMEIVKWLEAYTNIDLIFEVLEIDPSNILFYNMIKEGKMPDIIPEGLLLLSDKNETRLVVDFLEFQNLTPNFNNLLEQNPDFRTSVLAHTTPKNNLFNLRSYNPNKFIYDGVIAYRKDIFQKHNLKFDSWPELIESLGILKNEYPDSYPLGGSIMSLIQHFTTWWGSGMSQEHLLYFDPDLKKWKLGIYDKEFRNAIQTLADLMKNDIISPDSLVSTEEDLHTAFSRDSVFIAPYNGYTGISFGYLGIGYGSLDENGEWNGEGKWIEAMPLPKSPGGNDSLYSSSMIDISGSGYQVYNQSEYVGEAIALLDLLFSSKAAVLYNLGPEGLVWKADGDTILLQDPFKEAYNTGWLNGLRKEISNAGIVTGSPFTGLQLNLLDNFGIPENDSFKYFVNHDLQQNRPGIDVLIQPGVRFPVDDDFRFERALFLTDLRTTIESKLAEIITGQAPLSDFDKMVEDTEDQNDKLLELYEEWCIIPELLIDRR